MQLKRKVLFPALFLGANIISFFIGALVLYLYLGASYKWSLDRIWSLHDPVQVSYQMMIPDMQVSAKILESYLDQDYEQLVSYSCMRLGIELNQYQRFIEQYPEKQAGIRVYQYAQLIMERGIQNPWCERVELERTDN